MGGRAMRAACALAAMVACTACGDADSSSNSGGGAGGDGGSSSSGNPFGGASVCTSEQTWTLGEDVSDLMRPQMHPGMACNACHATVAPPDAPPIFIVAGTVYPTGHEPDECYGVDGTAQSDVIVQITDSQGQSYDLPVNATGNFILEAGAFVLPYTAKVISSKGERAMLTPQTSGDCNTCHTEQGGGAGSAAPGRIVVPW